MIALSILNTIASKIKKLGYWRSPVSLSFILQSPTLPPESPFTFAETLNPSYLLQDS
ncbi:MAG: hypothetical protein AAFQ80_02725 [Cyanobacteria bacterium J06621_8]